jgi:hypothetical protein
MSATNTGGSRVGSGAPHSRQAREGLGSLHAFR